MSGEAFIFVVIALAVGIGAGAFAVSKMAGRRMERDAPDQSLLMMQNQLAELTRTIDAKMGDSARFMQDSVKDQFSESKRLLQEINTQMRDSLLDVAREQTKTNEATRQFVTIAEQLGNLEKVLKHQKQRGN